MRHKLNIHNIKETIGLLVTFRWKLSFKIRTYGRIWLFLQLLMPPFWTSIRMEMWIRILGLKNRSIRYLWQNERMWNNPLTYTWPLFGRLSGKSTFFRKMRWFLQLLIPHFWTPVMMGIWIRMPKLKNWKGRHLWQNERMENKKLTYNWSLFWDGTMHWYRADLSK